MNVYLERINGLAHYWKVLIVLALATIISLPFSSGIGYLLILMVNAYALTAFSSMLNRSSTRKEGGTGLGMTISKKFVERMGGTIWIESEFGKGATVHFTIPVGRKLKEKESEEEQPSLASAEVEKKAKQKKNFILIL